MKIQISYNNLAEKIVIPVNPPSYKVGGGGTSFTNINVVKGGERTIIGDEKLETVSFSSFFPAHYDPTYCETRSLKKPWKLVKKINEWRNSGHPVKLLISGTNINTYYTIQTFDCEERGGEPGDVYYNFVFKRYEFITIQELVIQETNPPAEVGEERPDTSQVPKTYVVVKGDSLWKIAKTYYGNGAEYPKIYEANRDKIKNPDVIQIGWELVIP